MGLIVDKDSNAILTMVERSTNFLIMGKLKYDKKAMPLAKTVWRLLLPYMGEHLKTITTDNGSEFAEHEWIAHRLALDIYFTDAYASWQKGAIENTNKLIRQYITKGTDISTVTDKRIKMIQAKINRRPRGKIELCNTEARVLQILFVILHLLVDSLIIQPSSHKIKLSASLFHRYN